MDISDVSVVICTRNNVENIERVIQSIKQESPGEIIVVDGGSTDGTREKIEVLSINLLTDPGEGLAAARQIAVEAVQGKYLLFVGDDNILSLGSISALKEYIINHNWIGGGFITRVNEANKNYSSFCADLRLRARFFEGERDVIGTPYMFETAILRKASFDKSMAFSDDSDIEKRIRELSSRKFGYSNISCEEIGKTDFKETWRRFIMYGKSDAQFWHKYASGWSFRRKFQSLRHPARVELIDCIRKTRPVSLIPYALPYYLYITVVRYIGWIGESRRLRKLKKQ